MTVRHGDHGGLAGVRKRMDASPDQLRAGARMRSCTPSPTTSSTRYLDVTDLIENDIDAMEENVFSPTSTTDIEHIYLLKREVVELRRAVSPLTTDLQRIGTDHNDLVSKEVRRYMRDVLDHTHRPPTGIASYDEVLSSLVQAAVRARSRCSRTSTCARSRRGSRSPRCRPRWRASTA